MKQLFAVLDSFGLANQKDLSSRLATWNDPEFERFFQTYLEDAAQRPIAFIGESGTTNVYPDSASDSVSNGLISQLCVYVNKFYIHDPVLELHDEFLALDSFNWVLREPKKENRRFRYRRQFETAILGLLELRPLAEAQVLHVSPSRFLKERRDPYAIYAGDFFGPTGQLDGVVTKDSLTFPPELAKYVDEHLFVWPVKIRNGKPQIQLDAELALAPTRSIAIQFDDLKVPGYFFLSQVQAKPGSKSSKGQIKTEMIFPLNEDECAVDPQTFRHWVAGESRRYVVRRMNDLQTDMKVAALARAQFLTCVESTFELASVSLAENPSANPVVKALLELDLPYLSRISMNDLAKARENESAFQEFRLALGKALSEPDIVSNDEKREQAFQDLVHAPLAKIDKRLQSLNRNIFTDSVLVLGTLMTTVLSHSDQMLMTIAGLATVGAAAKAMSGFKSRKSEHDKISELPSYFYWQATKSARDKSRR